jgi:HTH-type transcriptional regulator/antitoxin HigA
MNEPSSVRPVAPGAILKRELEARGWTQKDLAEIINRPPQVITEIVRGSKQITPDTAMELAAALGGSADIWTNLETQYRLHIARARHSGSEEIAQKARLFSRLPITEMTKRGWIGPARSTSELEHEVVRFLGTTDLTEDPTVFANLRRSSSAADVAPALRAWVRRAEIVSSEQRLRTPYSPRKLHRAIPDVRALAASEEGVEKVPALLHELGIRFVIVESLPKIKIDGAALFNKNGSPILALSMRFDRIDYFWFTLMHELAHFALEHKGGHLDLEDGETIDGEEKAANALAQESLISSTSIRAFAAKNKPFSREAIEEFARGERVHAGIVVGRLHYDQELPYSHMRGYLVKVSQRLARWSDR